MQVERTIGGLLPKVSGERVSKTQITNPLDWDNKSKDLLIPSGVVGSHDLTIKGILLKMLSPEAGSASD